MNKLISVIVPIYNAEKYLEECIESILSQTYKNIELILINDGSTDNSLQICKKYKNIDSRIIIINKNNSGVSDTRNKGIDIAKGEYIGFVDSDDSISPYMYENLITRITTDDTDLAVLSSYNINEHAFNKQIINNDEAIYNLLLLKFPTSLWSYLYSANLIKDKKLDEEIHFFEDLEFNFRVLLVSKKISLANLTLYNYRNHSESTNSQTINKKRMTCLDIYNKLIPLLNNDRLKQSAIYFKSHCLLTVILSISKSNNVCSDFYSETKKNISNMYKEIFFSYLVPIKYKIIITLFFLFPKITTNMIHFIKDIK